MSHHESMTDQLDVLRYAAFASSPTGGNPAGVVLNARSLSDDAMQQIASDVGYSETAFITGPIHPDQPVPIRYFSPEGEVPFCGHATIATAAAIAEHIAPGKYELKTAAGSVSIEAISDSTGLHGRFDSPVISADGFGPGQLEQLLAALNWTVDDLHPDYVPGIGSAGNFHPVLVARSLEVLARLDYGFITLQDLCRANGWITIQLITPLTRQEWQTRNPFPYGGVMEDPATGSAAAAFCGYLKENGLATVGDSLTIHQGLEMGHPSRINARILEERARISGPSTPIQRQ